MKLTKNKREEAFVDELLATLIEMANKHFGHESESDRLELTYNLARDYIEFTIAAMNWNEQ